MGTFDGAVFPAFFFDFDTVTFFVFWTALVSDFFFALVVRVDVERVAGAAAAAAEEEDEVVERVFFFVGSAAPVELLLSLFLEFTFSSKSFEALLLLERILGKEVVGVVAETMSVVDRVLALETAAEEDDDRFDIVK